MRDWNVSWSGATTRLALHYNLSDKSMVYGSRAAGQPGSRQAISPTAQRRSTTGDQRRVASPWQKGETYTRGYALDLHYLLADDDRVAFTFAGERAVFGSNLSPIPPYSATGTTSATTHTLPLDYTGTLVPGTPKYEAAGRRDPV